METLFPNDLLVGNKPCNSIGRVLKYTATPYYLQCSPRNFSENLRCNSEHDHIIQPQPTESADKDHDQPVKTGQNTTNSFTEEMR